MRAEFVGPLHQTVKTILTTVRSLARFRPSYRWNRMSIAVAFGTPLKQSLGPPLPYPGFALNNLWAPGAVFFRESGEGRTRVYAVTPLWATRVEPQDGCRFPEETRDWFLTRFSRGVEVTTRGKGLAAPGNFQDRIPCLHEKQYRSQQEMRWKCHSKIYLPIAQCHQSQNFGDVSPTGI